MFPLYLLIFLSACGVGLAGKDRPIARQGSIDLSGWDFEKKGPLRLDGEWEFYWRRLMEPGSISAKGLTAAPDYFTLPGMWNRERPGYPNSGYATFRLSVKLPPAPPGAGPGRTYGLKIKEINSAYRLWVNGVPVASNGVVGTNRARMQPQFLPLVVTGLPARDRMELVLQVSNFIGISGGSHHSILLGTEEQVRHLRDTGMFYDIFLFGTILLIGFYHFWMFGIMRLNHSYLYFGMFCILMALRTILMGEGMLYAIFPGFPWNAGIVLEHLTMFIGFPAICLFVYSLYPQEMSKKGLLAILATGIAGVIASLSRSSVYYPDIIVAYQIFVLTGALYLFIVIIMAVARKRDMARLMVLGFCMLYAAVTNDVLYDMGIINTGLVVPLGMFIFLLSQMFALSFRYSMASERNVRLTEELTVKNREIQESNINLEIKVKERTGRLHNAYRKLANMYNDLREKDRLIGQDLFIARSIQERMMPRVETIRNLRFTVCYRPRESVGGDLYDITEINEGYVRILIADATGHGIQAAMITMIIKSEYEKLKLYISSPSLILEILNNIFLTVYKSITPFLSCIIFDIDLNKRMITYSSAGHHDQYIATDEGIAPLKSNGPLIGLAENFIYTQECLPLRPDMRIFLLTDGIIDAYTSLTGDANGMDRFTRVLGETGDVRAAVGILLSLIESTKWNEDDVTIIGIQPMAEEEQAAEG